MQVGGDARTGAFAADSRHFVVGSKDGAVRTYECIGCVDEDSLIALARKQIANQAKVISSAGNTRQP